MSTGLRHNRAPQGSYAAKVIQGVHLWFVGQLRIFSGQNEVYEHKFHEFSL